MLRKLLGDLNRPAVSRTALGLLGTAAVAGASQLALPTQMAALLAALHLPVTPFEVGLLCAMLSSILHRYTNPPSETAQVSPPPTDTDKSAKPPGAIEGAS